MVRRDGAETRRMRVSEINQALTGVGEGVSLKQFVAVQMVKTGLTKPKILEYLSLLQDIGNIQVDEKIDRIREIRVLKNEE